MYRSLQTHISNLLSWWTGLWVGLREDLRLGGLGPGNAFLARIVKPVPKNGPPLIIYVSICVIYFKLTTATSHYLYNIDLVCVCIYNLLYILYTLLPILYIVACHLSEGSCFSGMRTCGGLLVSVDSISCPE